MPKDQYDPAAFTHELLHIWLRSKDALIGPALKLSIGDDANLRRFISDELIEHIGNCLGHIKMFPEFVKLGYPPCDFLPDYDSEYIREVDTFLFERCMCQPSGSGVLYDADYVDQYIGKVTAALCDVNKSKDYSEILNRLQRLDDNLYSLIETLVEEWSAFDIENMSIFNDYDMMVFDFKIGLEDWASDKSFQKDLFKFLKNMKTEDLV